MGCADESANLQDHYNFDQKRAVVNWKHRETCTLTCNINGCLCGAVQVVQACMREPLRKILRCREREGFTPSVTCTHAAALALLHILPMHIDLVILPDLMWHIK